MTKKKTKVVKKKIVKVEKSNNVAEEVLSNMELHKKSNSEYLTLAFIKLKIKLQDVYDYSFTDEEVKIVLRKDLKVKTVKKKDLE